MSRLSLMNRADSTMTIAASGTFRKNTGAPAGVLDQPAAGDRSNGGGDRAETGPRANRPAAIGVVERGADDREAAWHEEGGADALHRTRRDQRARGSRETAARPTRW